MKPNFALSLSFEGIKLLHRAAGGWREVGEVPITADDLTGELAILRKTAASLEPGGVRTKLLIPSSQIKYLTIDTIGLSEAARRKSAEAALHDATPYEISELAYDISMDGAKTHIAAVARETLAEAEAFATEHRFHPVSFVAVPDDAPYLGEPFFGTTQGAADLLEPEETVEPDGIAVVIVGMVAAPEVAEKAPTASKPIVEPEPTIKPEHAVEPEKSTAEQSAASPNPEGNPPTTKNELDKKPAADIPTVDEPKVPVAAKPEPKLEPKLAVMPVVAEKPIAKEPESAATQKPAEPKVVSTPVPEEDAQDKPELALEPAPKPTLRPAPDVTADRPSEPKPVVQPTPTSAPETTPEGAGPSSPDTKNIAQPASVLHETKPSVASPTVPSASEPEPVDPKRAALLAAAGSSGASQPVPPPRPFKTATPIPDESDPVSAAAPTGFASRRNTQISPTAKPIGGAQRIAVRTPNASAPAPTAPQAAAPVATAARSIGGFLSRRKPRSGAAAPMAAPIAAVPSANTEAERMTVFGARTAQVGGKPRFLGLIMTVILLVFLAGVAAWAAVFLDEGIAGLIKKDSTRATASAPENQIDPEVIRTPEGIEPAQTDTSNDVQVAALDPVLSARDTATIEAAQNPRPEPEVPIITETQAAARYAVTGIWPLAPETSLSDQDTTDAPVFRSGIDPVSTANDAFALPSTDGFDTDVQLASVVSPPPFGQQTASDANGLIIPTVDGVVTPQGFTLFSASPPLKPPATLARFAATPTVEAPAATSALAALRPQNRPLGLAEKSERAQLGGVSRVELAAFRPSLRPSSLQDRAKEAEDAAKANIEKEAVRAAAAQSAAAAAALIVPTTVAAPAPVRGTRFATAQSKRPDTRPRNFARIVKRAQRAAPRAETQVAAASASVAPRTVAPSLPSKASVARSATVKNVLNLRKVNLIGIYGKPSSRRALIRLGNGRYQKVKVGDRIDGGRVAAISNSELRYSKSGRNVVLKMP